MSKPGAATYVVTAPTQMQLNQATGKIEPVPPYAGKVWGVQIVEGKGETADRKIAVEFADMGYKVEPDPRERGSIGAG